MVTACETPVVDGRACIKKIPSNRHAAEIARLLTTKEDHPPRSLRVPFKHIDAPLSRILPGPLTRPTHPMTTMEHVVDAVREQSREIMFLSELKFGLGLKNHRAGHA